MLQVQNVSKKYGSSSVFDRVSMSLEGSTITALQGHSGCGKSTLLRVMAFLGSFDEGVLIYKNQTLTAQKSSIRSARKIVATYPSISFLMQDLYLWPHLTCKQNIQLVCKNSTYIEHCQALGIDEYLDRHPHQISRGQAQRFAFVRALSTNPDLLLLDEPSSSLDRANTKILAGIINKVVQTDVSVLVVTHDSHLIASLNLTQKLEMENGKIIPN